MNGHGIDSPALAAMKAYNAATNEHHLNFSQLLDAYFLNGYIVSTPEYFVAARPVDRFAPIEQIVDPSYPFEKEAVNGWFICLMAGAPRMCWTLYPIDLEYVGYQRFRDDERVRWFKSSTLRRINTMGSKPKQKDPPPPIPPPTANSKDAEEARRQAQRNRASRKGNQRTLLAGQSTTPAGSTGGKTLLG
jgi:hypothetical protein